MRRDTQAIWVAADGPLDAASEALRFATSASPSSPSAAANGDSAQTL